MITPRTGILRFGGNLKLNLERPWSAKNPGSYSGRERQQQWRLQQQRQQTDLHVEFFDVDIECQLMMWIAWEGWCKKGITAITRSTFIALNQA